MEDVMPWPPQEIDLDEEKVRLSHHLSLSLDKLLNQRFTEQPSPRICRLKSSFGQGIVYGVSRGRIKTPKCIRYPYTIKSLTNCTELIDISSRLGHGISRSLVEELTTENAYRVMDQQNALPPGSKEKTFTIAVYDNIDRQEETLSGKFRFRVLIV
jgi:5-methylcytosine-specific restriction endonuclease McrA